MTRIEFVKTENLHTRAEELVQELAGDGAKILKTPLGKPYVGGNLIFISLTHSGERAAVAASDKPLGIDLETIRKRSHECVVKRFSSRERDEIFSELDFLVHWTAREAYVKMLGLALYPSFPKMEFFGGKMYFEGKEQPCKITHYLFGKKRVFCICSED